MPVTIASDKITFTDNTSLSTGFINTNQIVDSAVTAEKLASNAIANFQYSQFSQDIQTRLIKAWASIWIRENNSPTPRVDSSYNIGAIVNRGDSYNDGTTLNENYDIIFTTPLQDDKYVVIVNGTDGQSGGYYPPTGAQINAGGAAGEGGEVGVAFITPSSSRTSGQGSIATFTTGFQLTMVTTYYYPTHLYLIVI